MPPPYFAYFLAFFCLFPCFPAFCILCHLHSVCRSPNQNSCSVSNPLTWSRCKFSTVTIPCRAHSAHCGSFNISAFAILRHFHELYSDSRHALRSWFSNGSRFGFHGAGLLLLLTVGMASVVTLQAGMILQLRRLPRLHPTLKRSQDETGFDFSFGLFQGLSD